MVARPFKAGMTTGHQWPFRRVATAEEMRPSGVATRRTVWGPRPNAGPEGPASHQVVPMHRDRKPVAPQGFLQSHYWSLQSDPTLSAREVHAAMSQPASGLGIP